MHIFTKDIWTGGGTFYGHQGQVREAKRMQRDIPDDLKRSEDLPLDAERALAHLRQRADTLQEELDRLRAYIDEVRLAVTQRRDQESVA